MPVPIWAGHYIGLPFRDHGRDRSGLDCWGLIATVWWAASLTRRVDHIERWIAVNGHTAERLVALDEQIKHLSAGIARIEHYLRHNG